MSSVIGRRTRLGMSTLEVSQLGLGCMTMTRSYATPDLVESRATFDRALELGVDFLDTADSYAAGENETFIGQALAGRRDQVVLASKFGLYRAQRDGAAVLSVNNDPSYMRECCEGSLRRLKTDRIDLYYAHRLAKEVPVEETVGAMADLVHEGKVRYLGLSEVNASQLERAHRVHPITAVQHEWSLFARGVEEAVLPKARELGVAIVPFAPLGRGFLAGAISAENDLAPTDLRARDPRLSGANLEQNLTLFDTVQTIAADKQATPAQIALAWLFAQGDDVVPIPGTEQRTFLEQNVGALYLELTEDDLRLLGEIFHLGSAAGNADAVLLRDI
jgi:aryl-alcohol dehydrogenase-like predicted oxidoreductase